MILAYLACKLSYGTTKKPYYDNEPTEQVNSAQQTVISRSNPSLLVTCCLKQLMHFAIYKTRTNPRQQWFTIRTDQH